MTPVAFRGGLVALFGAVVALYWPSLWFDFADADCWNDVLEADRALSGRGSAWADGGYVAHQNLLRLTGGLSWIARYAAFGLSLPGWHAPSVLLHATNTVLLAILCTRLRLTPLTALVAAALFGLSPVHTHAVTWIGGTYDLFAGLFLLATLLAFARQKTVLGVICAVFGTMSKEPMVMLPAVLVLFVVAFERQERGTLLHVLRRVWPYALATLGVVGARIAQVAIAGSVAAAGLPARSFGLATRPLLIDGPTLFLDGLTGVLEVAPTGVALFVCVALIIALALRRLDRALLTFGLGAGFVLLLPVLLLIEYGQPMSLEALLHSPRYLYLPLVVATPIVASALLGTSATLRSLATWVGLALATSAFVVSSVTIASTPQPTQPVSTLVHALDAAQVAPKSHVYVLTNRYDEAAFRLLGSRWLSEHLDATVHIVQRGTWRMLGRDPARAKQLDFGDFVVDPAMPVFDPSHVTSTDRVFLLHSAENTLESVTLPTGTRAGTPQSLPVDWTHAPGGSAPQRIVELLHRPVVSSPPLWLNAASVFGFRLRYHCRRDRSASIEHRFERGYAELHWRSRGAIEDDAFVTIPLDCDEATHTAELPLWFDPVFRDAGKIETLGLVPYDEQGTVTIEQLEWIPR